MSKTLNISADGSLTLPIEFITQTQAILARKRVGKSYTASVQAEEMFELKQQVLVIDYTGAWWGLRAGRDGKADGGYPIHVFGGDHADVPLEERAGEVIAAAAVKERFSAILDMTSFRKNEALRFLATFLETLYRLNRDPLHLFCDEADAYAPQRTFGGEDARTLGAMNDIVLRGGIRGIGCSIITQRSARINKDVLSQCGILTALRTSSPKDLAAVKEWVEVHDEGNQSTEMMKSLPTLPIGTAWMWAPGWPDEDGIFQRVKIRQRQTFDSGATPKPGQAVKQPKTLRAVDLAKLGETIKQTAEQAKANDPAALRQRIRELEHTAAKPAPAAPTKEKIVERPFISDKQLARIEKNVISFNGMLLGVDELLERFDKRFAALKEVRQAMSIDAGELRQAAAIAKQPAAAPARPATKIPDRPAMGHDIITRPSAAPPGERPDWFRPAHQKLLNAAAYLAAMGMDPADRSLLAAIAKVSPKSSSFGNDVSRLSAGGYVSYPQSGLVTLTEAGRALVAKPEAPPSLSDLHRAWRECPALRPAHVKLLDAVITQYPDSMTREELAEAVGVSAKSSSFGNDVSRLSAMRLIRYPAPGVVQGGPLLFPNGLE